MEANSGRFKSILKSSSLIGGASLINMLIGMVRVKFVAVLLGPTGVGLMGTFVAITTLVKTVSEMGLSTSGVRQIAEAYGTGDETRIAKTVVTVRRMVWLTGSLGMLIMAVGGYWLAKWSFGNTEQAGSVSILSVTVLLAAITSGQSCLLQGTRRIADLAKVSIMGAVNGTFIAIPCYYMWGMKGIVPSLMLGSVAGLVTSWWFARRVVIKSVILSYRESVEGGKALLLFGLPLMLAAVSSSLTSYLIRIVMIRQIGLHGVGIYQAAFNLSGLVVNFVLLAMVADYYPRLTAVSGDNNRVAEEVNTQTEIALLLAGPGLMATLIFAPFAIHFFYSGRFDAAVDVLRWSVFGVFWRVVSWPMGYILLAKAKGRLFLATEIFAGLLHLTAVWFCTQSWGLQGTGIAYVMMYGVYTTLMLGLFFKLVGTGWSRNVIAVIISLLAGLIVIGFVAVSSFPVWVVWLVNILLFVIFSGGCLYRLTVQTGLGIEDVLARVIRKSS